MWLERFIDTRIASRHFRFGAAPLGMLWVMAATESRDPAEALLCVLTEGETWRMEQRGALRDAVLN